MENNPLIEVGKIGKSVGLNGGMKLHLSTDFPESIQANLTLTLKPSQLYENSSHTYTIKSFNLATSVVIFEEITTPEEAKNLTHFIAYASLEDTKNLCHLKEEEFFWFDIMGCEIIEKDETLGIVKDIQRIVNTDYLLVETTASLITKNLAKNFLIPYIDHFIIKASPMEKKIFTQGARDILETS